MRESGGGGGGEREKAELEKGERESLSAYSCHNYPSSQILRQTHACTCTHTHSHACIHSCYWAVQWSWFAQVYALCNLSCKKSWEVTVSLPGWFLSRCCFMLCITMEVEPWIAKQYKCHHYCSCKKYWGKGVESGKKVSSHLLLFFFWPEDLDFMEKMHFGASCSTSNKLLLVAKHILTAGLQKCLWGALKIHCPLWRKYAPEAEAAMGLKQCWAKVKVSLSFVFYFIKNDCRNLYSKAHFI